MPMYRGTVLAEHNKRLALRKTPFFTPPIIGRHDEIHRVVGFYRAAINANQLSLLWITGEAGVGKSRLMEAVSQSLDREKATILYLRLYPDSSSSVIPGLAETIGANHSIRQLLRTPVRDSVNSVMSSLRRITRLRPTALILEDLHLLSDEGARELTNLLHGLSIEPLCIIATSRSCQTPAYTAVTPHLADEMQLSPLKEHHVGEFLATYNITPEESLISSLYSASVGNCLALTSLVADFIRTTEHDNGQRIPEGYQPRRTYVQGIITAIGGEPLERLSLQQRQIAQKLSLLGEVFSLKSASIILENPEEVLEELYDLQVLTTPTTTIQPLWQETPGTSTHPIAFAHSLLHSQLLNETETPIPLIAEILDCKHGMYSLVPLYRGITSNWPQAMAEESALLLHRMIGITGIIHEWKPLQELHTLLEDFYNRHQNHWEEDTRNRLRAYILHVKLMALNGYHRREKDISHYRTLVEELLQITKELQDEERATYHLYGLFCSGTSAQSPEAAIAEVFTKAERVVKQFPNLKIDASFAYILCLMRIYAKQSPHQQIIERVQHYMEDIRAGDPELRTVAAMQIAIQMLKVFHTTEELQEREELSLRLHQAHLPTGIQQNLVEAQIGLLFLSGNVYELWRYVHRVEHSVKADRSFNGIHQRLLFPIVKAIVLLLIGRSPEQVMGTLHNYFVDLKESDKDLHAHALSLKNAMSYFRLLQVGLLTGADKSIHTSLQENFQYDGLSYIESWLALLEKDREALSRLIEKGKSLELSTPLYSAIQATYGKQGTKEEVERLLEDLLQNKVVRITHLTQIHGIIALAEMFYQDAEEPIPAGLQQEMQKAILHGLDWCEERYVLGCIPPLLERARTYLPGKEYFQRQKSLKKLREETASLFQDSSATDFRDNAFISLTMIGSITVALPYEKPKQIFGNRVRQALGVIIANHLTGFSFSLEQFRELSTDKESNEESANYARVLMSRLRDVLGSKEAVISNNGQAPQLNLDIVRVDLLDISTLLDESHEAIRLQQPRKAKQALLSALGILQGEPPFPTLYSNFFDALRLDLDLRLRQTLLETVRLLQHEGDIEESVDLLRQTLTYIPNDEEIAEMLAQLLEHIGRHTEAHTVRRALERELSQV